MSDKISKLLTFYQSVHQDLLSGLVLNMVFYMIGSATYSSLLNETVLQIICSADNDSWLVQSAEQIANTNS